MKFKQALKEGKILSTSATKEGLEKLINGYFYSKNYYIDDDMTLKNRTPGFVMKYKYKITNKNGRWKFEEDE